MNYELTYLAWSVILLVVHIAVQGIAKDLKVDVRWALGPQDEQPDTGIMAGRAKRALQNFLETYPAFVALALLIVATGQSTSLTAAGAALWFWGRVAYLPAYLSGIPVVRSLTWFVAVIGLLMMAWPFLFG